jgi:AcrR family transcriptional regulator
MRESVARRGVAASTFDHVAREAGVSRGLLHYYFGTKEQLLAEVVRRDGELRMALLDTQLADAHTADDVLERLVANLQAIVDQEPHVIVLSHELFTLSRRNDDIAGELSAFLGRLRDQLAALLAAKRDEGVLHLRAEPEAVADVLLAIGDGMAYRMIAEPDRDWAEATQVAIRAVRPLLESGEG